MKIVLEKVPGYDYNKFETKPEKETYRMRKYLCILALFMLTLTLCGCTSEAAQSVIDSINTLEEISYDSDSFSFSESKDKLIETDKKLDEIQSAYDTLEEKEKEQVTNFSRYEMVRSQFDALVSEKIESIAYQLSTSSYEEREMMKTGLDVFGDYMTAEQKQEIFALYAFYIEAPEFLDEYLSERLLSPSSYRRYDIVLESFVVEDNGTYTGYFDVKYGGTNAFGAEITKTVTGWLDFVVDVEKNTIKFVDEFIF